VNDLRKILSRVRRCVEDYGMIEAGDSVAVGVSGGKDSLTLLCALAKLRSFYPIPFDLKAISLDMGYKADYSKISALCEGLGVEYHVIPTNIKQIVFDTRKEEHPCSLCAKLRRGALNEEAKKLGCNKVALGHHLDDAVETFFMSLFFEGRINCFSPVTYLDRSGVTKIRPLLYVYERDIIGTARRYELPVLENECPANGHTKRQEIKELIRGLGVDYKDLKKLVFSAIQRSNLKGWQKIPEAPRRKSGAPPEIG